MLDNHSKSVMSMRVGWFGSGVKAEECRENHPLSASAVPPSGGGGNSSSGESSDEGSVVSLGDNRESLFRRNNSGGRKPKRFEQLAFNLTKAEFRILLNEGKIPVTEKQMRTIKQDILTSGAMTSISLKKMSNGNIHMSCERPGHTSGFQRMSFKISEDGVKLRVVQTAFDNNNSLVHQRPGDSKQNLYDVKK